MYFIGIGGIGMSALARYFHSKGKKVSGYDKTESLLTRELVDEGIDIHYTDDINLANKDADLVVWTPAIPRDHHELNYFLSNNSWVLKRSEVLGMVTRHAYNICIAGTHGKTTTSAMVAHMLRDSGRGCNAFLGGISINYNSNFWSSPENIAVAEADEYDRSFLMLTPDVAIITAMDPDHLDIYGTREHLEDGFISFSGKVKPGGMLLYKHGLHRSDEFLSDRKISYSVNDTSADCYALNIKANHGTYTYDLSVKGELIGGFVLHMGGIHNVENSIAAFVAARQSGVEDEKLKHALANFKGVHRRFEYIFRDNSRIYIDDYAHHPAELTALILGVQNVFPGKKITIVFQPHLYSRTNDFAGEFADALDLADEVILLPIYPARELPIEGVSSLLIAQKMKRIKPVLLEKSELISHLRKLKTEALITAGAGDIDRLVQPIKEMLEADEA